MNYSKSDKLVYLEIQDLTPEVRTAFHEFLRKNMIAPTIKGVDVVSSKPGETERYGHFSAAFSRVQAHQIELWLKRNKVHKVD